MVECGLNAPSAMVRALQYRDLLARRTDVVAEFRDVRWQPLDALLGFLERVIPFKAVPRQFRRLEGALTRLREVRLARHAAAFDVVFMVKVPFLRTYVRLAAVKGPRLWIDVNDGLWLPAHQAGGWKDLDRMLPLVHGVICENRYVAEYARKHCPRVHVVHDPPQVELFDRRRDAVRRDPSRITIGWIGSLLTAAPLYSIWEPLERLFAKHPHLHFRIVGADPSRLPHFEKVRYSVRPKYDQASMIEEVLAMDIGVFPLFAVEEALARGTLKAMIYMSGGAVAVARDIGENRDLIQDGVNGFLAGTPEEWFEKLDRLVQDAELRRRMSEAGLETIRAGFTKEKSLDQLIAAFREQGEA